MALHYSKEKSGQFPEEILIDKLVRITFLKEPCKSWKKYKLKSSAFSSLLSFPNKTLIKPQTAQHNKGKVCYLP